MRWLASGTLAWLVGAFVGLLPAPAWAQNEEEIPRPERSKGWDDATKVTALSAMGIELLMPRIFYSDPEVTVGWKARWHASVLAPTMTLAAVSLLNEVALKDAIEGYRPECSEENQNGPGCASYAMMSTHTFAGFSAFGQGAGIFLVDTLKWSHGRFNFGAFAANTAVPGVLSVITAAGRTAGNWENPGQVWGSAGIGFLAGLGMGALYGATQRPECGYSGAVICW
jgi:hypothetical protein